MAVLRVPSQYSTLAAAHTAAAPYGDTILISDFVDFGSGLTITKLVNIIVDSDYYSNSYDGFDAMPVFGTSVDHGFLITTNNLAQAPYDNFPVVFEGIKITSQYGCGILELNANATNRTHSVDFIFNRCLRTYVGTSGELVYCPQSTNYLTNFNFLVKNSVFDKFSNRTLTLGQHTGSYFTVEKSVRISSAPYYPTDPGNISYGIDEARNTSTLDYGVGSSAAGFYSDSVATTLAGGQFWSVSGQIQNIPAEIDVNDFKVLLFREDPTNPNYPQGPIKNTTPAADGTWQFNFIDFGYRYGILINPPDGMKGHWLKWYNPVAPV
jgi:hypothetical protein